MPSDRILRLIRSIWLPSLEVLKRAWETPEVMACAIEGLLHSSVYWTEGLIQQVQVAGASNQQVLCLQGSDLLLLCHVQQGASSTSHPFIRELVEEFSVNFEEHKLDPDGVCLIALLSERLKARLKLPSVLLVSLFHPDMYPTARLTLGISYLASYLRQRHLASVKLMDCQFDVEVVDVMEQIYRSQPDILGVSVNFGQFDLMEQLLDALYDSTKMSEPPLVILGNILPAMCFQEILKVYPQVVICRREGELALAELVRWGRDRSRWNQVPGIYYCSDQGRLISTPPRYLPLENLPPPALDTVPELFAHDGVITAEFSRGCQYNQCSFCPRSHKSSIWRTVPIASMLEHWEVFAQVFQHFNRMPHVFLADEDFVGRENADATVRRITDFLDEAQARNLRMTFDASCRADQIFRQDRDTRWHLERGRLFQRCLQGGLARLFLGIESGASAQLLRYNKGSTVEEMVSAIRYLSLLGVRLRFGFIFFDPLMSVQDVIENIDFLGRTDIILPALPGASIEEIYALVSSNHQQEIHQMSGPAVYEDVSYMVSPLEVLVKSRYHFDLQQQAPHMMSKQIDVSFARYSTSYVVPEIGIICKACQYWVNYCFPIVYALKGLQKVSHGEEKALLHRAITAHRYLGYMLIRGLAEIFSLVDGATAWRWESNHRSISGSKSMYAMARQRVQAGYVDEAISSVLQWYEAQVQHVMAEVNTHLAVLSASKREVWRTAYAAWIASSLSEASAQRTS
ncbi:MAG TPA: cobalamin-dependent protein [Ktedonosporobacter sp.]|jgi:radical SAM superfamily enzyme YgiQ (UPF0313 family)|nr:cobalamin-dependent protein [Ktedonosporobacter sp.]